MKRILNKIKEYETIIIHAHKRPDGDCYGAQFGLKDIITNTYPNKTVYAVGEYSDYVSFVGKVDEIEDSVFEGALSIVVDTATEERISDPRHKLAKEVIKIDHHIPVDDYGDIRWVDTNFPSCAQMITYFYVNFQDELKLTPIGAQALYTGIVTDTGRFRYRGVSRLTHQLAGLLIDKGADIEYIDLMLSRETLQMVKFKGHVLKNFEITEGGLVLIRITKQDVIDFGITQEQAGSMVNVLSGIDNYRVWALALENPNDDEIRIRLRSSGPIVSDLANKYRGGGHAMASGATLDSWAQLNDFIKDAEEVIKKFNDEQL